MFQFKYMKRHVGAPNSENNDFIQMRPYVICVEARMNIIRVGQSAKIDNVYFILVRQWLWIIWMRYAKWRRANKNLTKSLETRNFIYLLQSCAILWFFMKNYESFSVRNIQILLTISLFFQHSPKIRSSQTLSKISQYLLGGMSSWHALLKIWVLTRWDLFHSFQGHASKLRQILSGLKCCAARWHADLGSIRLNFITCVLQSN